MRNRHVPRSQKDPGSWISRIQDPRSWGILDRIFSFSHGILEILDPVMATLSWDPRDLGSRTEKILLDTGDPGSSLRELSWDLADFGFCTTVCHYFEDTWHLTKFWFWFPISIRRLNLSTVKIFNDIFIQSLCVDLKTNSPCWFLHMFSIIECCYQDVVERKWTHAPSPYKA